VHAGSLHWPAASTILHIQPYFNPHSLRNTLVHFGETVCKTPEEFKAWIQNLGHVQVLTTFCNYGQVTSVRQGAIFRELANSQQTERPGADEFANQNEFAKAPS